MLKQRLLLRSILRRALSTAAKPEEPVLARVYGGLSDQDRIFSNLYGEQDWRLSSALKRGRDVSTTESS